MDPYCFNLLFLHVLSVFRVWVLAFFVADVTECLAWVMPCSFATHRARTGMFYPLTCLARKTTKSIFQTSFLYFVLLKMLAILYPAKILLSFAGTFIVSLLMMLIIMILIVTVVLILQISFYDVFLRGSVKWRGPLRICSVFVHLF